MSMTYTKASGARHLLLLLLSVLALTSGCATKLADDQPTAGTGGETAHDPAKADPSKKPGDKKTADSKDKEPPKPKFEPMAPWGPQSATQKAEGEKAKLRYEQGITLMKANKLDQAFKLFSELSKTYPSLVGPIVNQGIILRKKKQYKAARDLLKGALLTKEKNPYLLNELGIAYRHLGSFESAKKSYLAAIKLTPKYAKAHYNLAVLADLYLHDWPLAIKEFKAFQALQPTPNKSVAGWIKELERRTPSGGNQ